jgi:hypothetical protein
MNSAVFSTGNESYQVSQILHIGPVTEIPEKIRKDNGATHSFKLVTPQSGVYCYYRSEEAAMNARRALGAMVRATKPSLFGCGHYLVDPAGVISFSNVVALKNPSTGGRTHAFVVTIDTTDERHRKVWLRYTSEDNAKKARRAMFAAVHEAGRLASTPARHGNEPVNAQPVPETVAA